MSNLKTAVIGVGNMGSKYAALLQDNKISGMELSALTRLRSPYKEMLLPSIEAGVPVFESADLLFEALESGALKLDCLIIATPHYSHEAIAKRAFKNGLNVLCDKPSGVYSRQARAMEEEADISGKVFSMVFNQRTSPMYQRLKEIVESGKYGALKRFDWTISDWYRPQKYYTSNSWHATWDKDGGGVLLNQAPHNLDLLQWICGMPVRVQAFCHEGRFHDIEVEDDVTAYLEWAGGATGIFVTSTGDAPGLNRLVLSLEEAIIICENDCLRIGSVYEEMGMKEREYRASSEDYFRKIKGTWTEISFEKEPSPYERVLQGFSDECNNIGRSVASGKEGRKSLILSNAMYLSSWEKRMVEIPEAGSEYEKEFEKNFELWLDKKRRS